jgi:hypothetical protein
LSFGLVVGGNQFIYYNPLNGRDHVSPDVFVLLDVASGVRNKVMTWVEGKFPEIVFEITSESTVAEDLGPKRFLYARLGAREYYIFDPTGVLQPPFRAFHAQEGRLDEIAMGPDGAWSPLLGAYLRVVGPWLRLIDPATGLPISVPDEELAARRAAEKRARRAEEEAEREAQARAEAEKAVERETLARAAAEEQTGRAARARAEAEERASSAERALREALEALARLRDEQSGA